MKQLLLFLVLSISIYSCNLNSHNKWVINSVHEGVVINAFSPYNQLTISDSGNIYHCIVDHDMWIKIYNDDTIVHFNK